ncbi:hypothetical protein G7Y41_02725 [Schaalia sp. ZJ405]|uniref:hypothetical protein n=1 Tax=Schaalia sp. ZJ405 TaxID=2709403 RepID=UPI0013EBA566|nr:hypothetical protein [Schaalia sp. ZJ405]QPK81765.1 hypothetical protein G7Y41_02725 [Schaalia sp. ZJ405]
MSEEQRRDNSVLTSMIHRITRGPVQWWHTAVIGVLSDKCDESTLGILSEQAEALGRIGFDAVVVEPSHSGVVWDSSSSLSSFISRAHDFGLRVIVRLAGVSFRFLATSDFSNEDDITTLIGRVRASLEAGADGIDLGILGLNDASLTAQQQTAGHARLTRLTGVLLAEIEAANSSAILVASTGYTDADMLRTALEDNWFHHLRDSVCSSTPWDADRIIAAIRASLRPRDPIGAITPWSWTSSTEMNEDEADLASSRQLLSLALPGASYNSETARAIEEGDSGPIPEALRIRRERRMGAGSLGIVTGLPWACHGVVVLICAGVTIVVNTSGQTVDVPREHALLVSSQPAGLGRAGATLLPANSCAWFETAPVRPPKPRSYE